MPFLTAPDAIRLSYTIEGDGPPLVLHLGAGCDSELWRAAGYLDTLTKNHRCILFDHRGHGRSERPRGPEANHINRYVADVVALLDHLGLERSAYWGYGLAGVAVGLKVAQEYPSRISTLVGSGGVSKTTPAQVAEVVARGVPELREYGWEKMIGRFTEQEPSGVPEWLKECIRTTDIGQLIDWRLAMPEWNWNGWESLPHVTAPTVFVVGELEDPEDQTGEGAALMPNGTRLRVTGQGHINAFIKSHLVLPGVTAFLAAHTV
ncbi:MAG: alpha/beta hydrolase [Candidatus Dormibacteraceae bacterium]